MTDSFARWSHRAHERHFDSYAATGGDAAQARTWLRTDTTDYWRHAREYACLEPLLAAFPGASWITIGDGRYGRDAHYLHQHGAQALATDIADTLLKEGKEAGFIEDYQKEDAEALSFGDASFDFAFCKESLHHMPRPMMALYEMLRVTRQGVIFVEPNEDPTLPSMGFAAKRIVKRIMMALGLAGSLRSIDTSLVWTAGHSYEESGNYVYGFSSREIEKVAAGLDLPAVAFKGLNDWYVKGVEFETAAEGAPLFGQVRRQIAAADRRCRRGLSLSTPVLLVACILKTSPSDALKTALAAADYRVVELPRNPYIGTAQA